MSMYGNKIIIYSIRFLQIASLLSLSLFRDVRIRTAMHHIDQWVPKEKVNRKEEREIHRENLHIHRDGSGHRDGQQCRWVEECDAMRMKHLPLRLSERKSVHDSTVATSSQWNVFFSDLDGLLLRGILCLVILIADNGVPTISKMNANLRGEMRLTQ